MKGKLELMLTCEHGGNAVPRAYRTLFDGHSETLRSHRGYDPGALDMARYLARRFSSRLHASVHTRLLVELNRSRHHPRLFSEITRRLERHRRNEILERHYEPHRQSIEHDARRAAARGRIVLHLASHTFTPELDGVERSADVAWLYDPKRVRERDFVSRWRDHLVQRRPDLRLRRNYPYRGTDDGLTTHLRKQLPRNRYLGIELEINQALFLDHRSRWLRLREAIGDTLEATLAQTGRKR